MARLRQPKIGIQTSTCTARYTNPQFVRGSIRKECWSPRKDNQEESKSLTSSIDRTSHGVPSCLMSKHKRRNESIIASQTKTRIQTEEKLLLIAAPSPRTEIKNLESLQMNSEVLMKRTRRQAILQNSVPTFYYLRPPPKQSWRYDKGFDPRLTPGRDRERLRER